MALCLSTACTGCIEGRLQMRDWTDNFASALPARGASGCAAKGCREHRSLPRRCLHGVHPLSC